MPLQQASELPSEYDTLQVGIGLYDPDTGTVLDANERLEAMLGYTAEELSEHAISEYTANTYAYSETDFRQRLRTAVTGDPQQFTWRIKRADGELIWTQIHLSRQTTADTHCVRAEVRDITDYYETHHRAELFWRLLRHNLRNEATIIGGNTDRIREHAQNETVREASETVASRVEKLGSMAVSVREIERAVAQSETERVRRHATKAVASVAADVSSVHPEGTITVDEREPMWVSVDEAFEHALTHALENAIVHSETAAPSVEVSVGPSPNTGRVEIRISDTNPPIPDNEIDALSTPAEITSTSHGSGVGLFVMKWCVESLGGEIKFERSDSRGNTVYFYLPPKAQPADGSVDPGQPR